MYDESKYRSYAAGAKQNASQKAVLGFGIRDRIGDIVADNNASKDFIWKKLYQPEHTSTDPTDPKRISYHYHDWDKIEKEVIEIKSLAFYIRLLLVVSFTSPLYFNYNTTCKIITIR
jgi:hypothetical protein